MPEPLPLTLAVITYNEAAGIARCLDSVPFAAEKLVVDCGSTDDTCAIAQAHGARVVHQDWLGFGPQRNFASTCSSHDWILALDADEWLSPELAKEMQVRLSGIMDSPVAAVTLCRRTSFMGAPMRFYRPARAEKLPRIYHRGRAQWRAVRVHESLQFSGASPILRAPLEHANNPTLAHRELKALLYAELKSRDRNARAKTMRMWQTPFLFVLTFLKDYVLRLGALDGWRGFIMAQTEASYAVYKRMRYYEMRRNPDSVGLGEALLKSHGIER